MIKKNYLKAMAVFLAAITAITTVGATTSSASEKFELDSNEVAVYAGKSAKIAYKAPANIKVKVVNKKIASAVTKKKNITIKGLKAGKTVAVVKCNNKKKKIQIVVKKKVENTVSECTTTKSKVNRFSVELFNAMRKKGDNTYISPLSVYSAYAMASNGASGNTQSQIFKTLGVKDLNEINTDMSGMISGNVIQDNANVPAFQINNSFWVAGDKQINVNIDNEFINPVKQYYKAEVFKDVNFADVNTCQTINNWVANKTGNKITNMFDKINSDTAAILLNTAYFECDWLSPFDISKTKKEIFKSASKKSKVNMMVSNDQEYKYYKDDMFEGVEIGYKGSYVMDVLMAVDENKTVGQVWDMLNTEKQEKIFDKFDKMNYKMLKSLKMPKFDIKYESDLVEVLKKMGMKDVFSANADFSKIGNGIWLTESKHKTSLSVTEKGTVSSAATSVVLSKCLAEDNKLECVVDRPFICCIRNKDTGVIMFIGEINNIK